ncbi:YccS family putative transporter [Veronia pacifica]|uniref:TIGR01666 family membrane protein n=1 Tax=Veronia pacifica TaxID=1080227 RepID=A0A1C3EPN2_9GAMM|nr:YccS family putative transporter [Veronia pacifica]ODA35207.1 TIGR01666 family membrane protein [Veronia pacifica]
MNRQLTPNKFRHYWSNSRINYSIRVFIALSSIVLACWWQNSIEAINPLVLGVIASALAETDDSLVGRFKSLTVTLICFSIATLSVSFLFPYPELFAAGLFCSTFFFVMLGAIGSRYATIAFASLMIAVYTMLSVEDGTALLQPTLLMSGASWYGLISLIWLAIWPLQPVQHHLSSIFAELGDYFSLKSDLFLPTSEPSPQQTRLKLANQNSQVVGALNLAKSALLSRTRRSASNNTTSALLQSYFIAQDIHERISSSHYLYADLYDAFFHSDLLFRVRLLMQQQAHSCRAIAEAITLAQPYQHAEANQRLLLELADAIEYVKQHNTQASSELIAQVDYLFRNLETVENQLNNVTNAHFVANEQADSELADFEAHSVKEKFYRIKAQLTPKALLFRHGIRLATALTVGYGVIQMLDLEQGYWLMLTALFVCQPSYAATRSKLTDRVFGTVSGLAAGLPLMTLFPDSGGQLALMVVFGMLFFAFRVTHYMLATTCITLFVLMSFNQLGHGFAVMVPRMADTIAGCIIAALAVRFILPDWQAHRLRGIMSDTLTANSQYLQKVLTQYHEGKQDTVEYRVVRRQAHNKDSQLTTAMSNMLAEPGRYRTATDEGFRFLCLTNAMLGYISAIGAHRQPIESGDLLEAIETAHQHVSDGLAQLVNEIDNPDPDIAALQWEERPSSWRELNHSSDSAEFILRQLSLIERIIPELYSLIGSLNSKALNTSKA